jgi:hypothetical protein
MTKNKQAILNGTIIFFVAIYFIYSVQFIVSSTSDLVNMSRMSYSQKLDALDFNYYHKNVFYRYYVWLNELLPKDTSFSIYFNGSVSDIYFRYERRLSYYFYPKHILPGEKALLGYEGTNDWLLRGVDSIKDIKYSDLVFVLKNNSMNYQRHGRLKYVLLNHTPYYLVALLDDKGLLAKRSFILSDILIKNDYQNLRDKFKELYGANMKGVHF